MALRMTASALCEPFTPRGIAAFARAGIGRLLLAQFILALFAAGAVGYFFYRICDPAIQAAVDQLPATGQIHSGRLTWNYGAQILADGPFLAFDVDPDHSGQWMSASADFQIEFGRKTIRVTSLFGYADFDYPTGWSLPFNQPQLDPLWKAWRAEILLLITGAAFLMLPVTWWVLAAIYFAPIWVVGFIANRDLGPLGSLKLCCAALLPGSLLMTTAIILFVLAFLNFITFCFIFVAHLILQWLYLCVALPFLPRAATATPKGNPFKPASK